MSKVVRKFDRALLDSAITEANATLIGDYAKINGTTKIRFQCTCSKEGEKRFNNLIYYGGAYCKNCINQRRSEKIKITCKEKYGVDNPSQLQEIKDKKNETNLKHFGCHPLQSKEIQEKKIALHLVKYGCENPSQRIEVKDKMKETFREKYGGHPMHNDEVKSKVKETCFEKYGGYPAENEIVKQKMMNTFNERYGGAPMTNESVREKVRNTCIEKYGAASPFQSIEIMAKTQENAKKYKKYTLPSGKIINIQGYENYALDILLKTYPEDNIITQRSQIPRINYIKNDKNRYYFPDIFLPSENKIIEVKSTWTYQKDIIVNQLKWDATKKEGYLFEVWIFDHKGKRVYANGDGTFSIIIPDPSSNASTCFASKSSYIIHGAARSSNSPGLP